MHSTLILTPAYEVMSESANVHVVWAIDLPVVPRMHTYISVMTAVSDEGSALVVKLGKFDNGYHQLYRLRHAVNILKEDSTSMFTSSQSLKNVANGGKRIETNTSVAARHETYA